MSDILSIEELIYLDISQQTVELLSKTTDLLENLKSLTLQIESDNSKEDEPKDSLLLKSKKRIPKGKNITVSETNIRKYSQEYQNLWDEYHRLVESHKNIV